MQFTSAQYFLFLPVLYLIFYFTADRWRWVVLLSGSYCFYAALRAPYLLAVLLAVTVISYGCGIKLAAQQEESLRKRWFWIGAFACITILALFKYLPFLESKSNALFGLNTSLSLTVISIGTSYFIFQAVSYLADIYFGTQKPECHLGHYALYMAFFPKLLQGPIERAGDLLPQLKKPYRFDYDEMRSGILLFTWGVFKKLALANTLSYYSDHVFNDVHSFVGIPLFVATYAYAAQIYFDFSGYTDMARGTARIFGINLTENFKAPYLATSIAEFWRRWHISFSRWILDYIFMPLHMTWRYWGQFGTVAALIVAFFVSGIWHGATWGFVVWGVLHGCYLAGSTLYRPYQKKWHKKLGVEKTSYLKVWQIFCTINLVCFAWIFFRANSIGDALYVTRNLFNFADNYRSIAGSGLHRFVIDNIVLKRTRYDVISLMIMFLPVLAVSQKQTLNVFQKPAWYRWAIYSSLVFAIVFFAQSSNSFIYFKF